MANVGDRVKNVINGFKGIVTGKTIFLNGCARLSVQPEDLKEDGSVKSSHTFDEQQLEVLSENAVAPGSIPPSNIKLGDRVKSNINGFEGLVSSITTMLSGEVCYDIEPEKLDKDGNVVKGYLMQAGEAVLVQALPVPVSTQEKAKKEKSPGGPREDSRAEQYMSR